MTEAAAGERGGAWRVVSYAVAVFFAILACVTLLGALDVARHMGKEPTRDALTAVFLWTVGGVAVALPASALVTGVAWPLRRRVPLDRLVTVLVTLALQVIAVVVFEGGASLALLVLAAGVGAGLARARWAGDAARVATLCAALVLALPTAVRIVRAAGPAGLLAALACAFVAASLALTHRLAARSPARATIALALLGGALLLPLESGQARSAARDAAVPDGGRAPAPNVVLIVLDTTRRDHFGAYGHPGRLTPTFDALAREAALFEDAIAPSEWTVPSHASLFTGLYPVTHGTSFAHHLWLDPRFETLAEMLGASGYQTCALVANRYIQTANLDQGFDDYVSLVPFKAAMTFRLAAAVGAPERWVDQGSSRAVEELHAWLGGRRDPSRPFFLFVNVMEPHAPYLPPRRYRKAHLPEGIGLRHATQVAQQFSGIDWLAAPEPPPAAVQAIVRGMYAGEVEYQDQQLRRLLDALRGAVDPDETVLIVTSDHGENLGEGGRWDHAFALNDHLLRVPLLVRYAKAFPAGSRVAGQVELVDIVPTVFDLIGRPCPVPDLPGRSLAPAHFWPRDVAFAEAIPDLAHFERIVRTGDKRHDLGRLASVLRAARTREHKLVRASNGEEMLCDLVADPDETADILARRPAVAESLRAETEAWWSAQPRYERPRAAEAGEAERLSEEQRKALESLGYLH
jgi:arylsulfatase A-like enzyme